MKQFYCRKCEKNGNKLMFGLCIRDHPEDVKHVLPHDPDYDDGESKYLNDEVTSKTVEFAKIDSEYTNNLITFKAKIIAVSDIMTYDIVRNFECPECGNHSQTICDDFRDIKSKTMCDECHIAMINKKEQTITGNIRKMLLQDVIQGSELRKIDAVVLAQRVFNVRAGLDYKFMGKLRSISMQKHGQNISRMVIDIVHLKCLDNTNELKPTQLEIEMFISKDVKKIINSLAPQIMYREREKMAGLLSIISGDRIDNMRGDMNVLYVGDPSTGKSEILSALHGLDVRSYKISGRSASAAGMVAGVDNLSDGTRIAVLGPVPLAHKHFVCIDEMDKMNPNDRSMLHDVMEDQVARLTKIGINLSVPAETKIIGAANPKASHYDKDATIKANIGMPDSLLARFGYIFLCLDDFDNERERKKIQHINRIKEIGLQKVIDEDGLLSREMLTKYINHAKSFHPKFDVKGLKTLEDMYIKLRFREQSTDSLPIDTRAYHDIIRSAYAFARFRFSKLVQEMDVKNAWKLYLESLESFGMTTTGEMRQAILSNRDATRQQWITECLEKVRKGKLVNLHEFIVELMKRPKLCKDIVHGESIIDALQTEGRLLNTGQKFEMILHG